MVAVSSFIQAKWFGATRDINSIRVIVVHDMEAPEKGLTAENVANYFKNGSGGRPASAHYNVDNDTIVQSVRDDVVAFHAPGCNSDGIGIEHAGYMAQSRNDWLDEYSSQMLDLSARLAADLCIKYKIPAVHLSNAELKAGNRGFVGHDQVSDVYKKSDHGDPGPGFPWDAYIEKVKFYITNSNNGISTGNPIPPPVVNAPIKSPIKFKYPAKWDFPFQNKQLRIGDSGPEVEKLQRLLRALNYTDEKGNHIVINGQYTRNTGFPIGYIQMVNKQPETWVAEYPNITKFLGKEMIDKLKAIKSLLSAGIKGFDVIFWQAFLKLHNPRLKIDGVFGKSTLKWTKQFQKDNGLTQDGIVGPNTIAKACESVVNFVLSDL